MGKNDSALNEGNSKKLPDHLEEKRRLSILTNEAPTNTRNMYYSGAYRAQGVDNSFDYDKFKKTFSITMTSGNYDQVIFDVVGLDAPIANAIRRIILSEVPTMAIEKVYIYNNTSVMQDEVLAHRLGLIPIRADPRKFIFRTQASITPFDTLVFKLHVKCAAVKNTKGETISYTDSTVLSKHLEFIPKEEQIEQFGEGDIGLVNDDIILAKLRPGQEIQLEAHCEKGYGKDHAKFSPVATAYYRLLPEISFRKGKQPTGESAKKLVKLCPMNVFDIEDIGGVSKAVVKEPRNCSMCRECIREQPYTDAVQIGRVKDHFIYSVETTGALSARTIVHEATQVLMDKCTSFLAELDRLTASIVPPSEAGAS